MSRVDYDRMATHYDRGRGLTVDGLSAWRAAIERHLPKRRNLRLLDLGAGTGQFCFALAEWFDARVIAIEPAARMRRQAQAKSGDARVFLAGGSGERIPLGDGTCDAAWLSTVIHHIGDLPACARELKRVLVDDGVVLIRSAFPGHLDEISLFRFFPGARRVVETFPTVEATTAAFTGTGFVGRAIVSVPQVSAANLREACERVRLRADTTLQELSDDEFAAGLAEIERAARRDEAGEPIIDRLDLLVFEAAGPMAAPVE